MIKKSWINKSRKEDFLIGQKALIKSKIISLCLITFMLFLIIGIYKPSSVESTYYIVNADIILPLKENKVIQGVEFPKGSYVVYYKSGKLKSVRLGEPISVPGQLFSKAYFGDPTFITKIDFSARTELFFYEDEKLGLKKIILPEKGAYSLKLPEIKFCSGSYEKINPKPEPFQIEKIKLYNDVTMIKPIILSDGSSLSFYKSGKVKKVYLGKDFEIPYKALSKDVNIKITPYYRKSDVKKLRKVGFSPGAEIYWFIQDDYTLYRQSIEKGSYFEFNEFGKLKEIYLAKEIKLSHPFIWKKEKGAQIKHFNFNNRKLVILPYPLIAANYSSPIGLIEKSMMEDFIIDRAKNFMIMEDFIIDENEACINPFTQIIKIQGVYQLVKH